MPVGGISNPKGPNAALIDGIDGTVVSRDELRNRALAIGGGLRERGLQKQDVAMIFGANSLYWVMALLGCQAADVIVSPANYG
jgi:acyl-CoA synthetase (AMP-forming)/AMP-acid ligase II